MAWVKGQSGNLKGRPPERKATLELDDGQLIPIHVPKSDPDGIALARRCSEQMVRVLMDIANDETNHPRDRTVAAVCVLDRAYGKPAATIQQLIIEGAHEEMTVREINEEIHKQCTRMDLAQELRALPGDKE